MDPKLMQLLALISLIVGVILAIVTKILYTKKTAPRIKELNEKTYSELTLKEMNEFKRLKRQNISLPFLIFVLFLVIAIVLLFISIIGPLLEDLWNIYPSI